MVQYNNFELKKMAVNHYDLEFLLEQANKLFSRDNWAHEIIDQTIGNILLLK